MSRLTTPIFNKPSPFDVPRPVHPLSPPDTEQSFSGPGPAPQRSYVDDMDSAHFAQQQQPQQQPSSSQDTPGARLRRVAYINSTFRDTAREPQTRDRSAQKTTRSLLVVIPPPSLRQQHGQLGHTLASGPEHRLNQGILMPLFPTMYAQLTAIAREFNFPSTTGLCLYLQITDNGFTMTPRISDDTWQFLWAHLLDGSRPVPSAPHQLPIGGRIEFDIDLRKARWFEPWLGASRRELVDMPISVAPSLSHWRQDSRTSFADEQHSPQDAAEAVTVTPPSLERPKHTPRKLSLLDRLDTLSVRSGKSTHTHTQTPQRRTSPPRPEQLEAKLAQLPTIDQADEPKSAKKELETRVKSWRASAQLGPSVLVSMGQTSLDPANMPNVLPLDHPAVAPSVSAAAEDDDALSELNLDDFTWSITSAGPQSDPPSPMSWGRVDSPHLDRRLQGSVCLTPSVCTSFGPDDYDVEYSPISYSARLPTPDLAMRMYSDCPPTPTTVTTWGPDSWPASPVQLHSRPHSVHLGHRGEFSRPATPSTATTWGPDSWPASPRSDYSAISSVHLADRAMFSPTEESFPRLGHSLVFPYYDAWSQQPWGNVWPYQGDGPWRNVWPYQGQAEEPVPSVWNHVWPYQRPAPDAEQAQGTWSHVWPYHGGASASAAAKANVRNVTAKGWGMVWPYRSSQSSEAKDATGYPMISLYRAAYPHFDLYPSIPGTMDSRVVGEQPTRLEAAYPRFNLYPAAYPVFEIYPGATCIPADKATQDLSVTLRAKYPAFDLYPAVYPNFDIYAPMPKVSKVSSAKAVKSSVIVRLPKEYPLIDLYPAGYPQSVYEIYAPTSAEDREYYKSRSVILEAAYPAFDLYPARYPTLDIYPSAYGEVTRSKKHLSQRSAVYPFLDLYPAGKRFDDSHYYRSLSVGVQGDYPNLVIYPAQCSSARVVKEAIARSYPFFVVYPAGKRIDDTYYFKSLPLNVQGDYPNLVIYPAPSAPVDREQYPGFVVYPVGKRIDDTYYYKSLPLNVQGDYPNLIIYPALSAPVDREQYPYFVVYPIGKWIDDTYYYKSLPVGVQGNYPNLIIYPAPSAPVDRNQYPCFVVYPSGKRIDDRYYYKSLSVGVQGDYPNLLIYPAPSAPVDREQYPYFVVYPLGKRIDDTYYYKSLPVGVQGNYPNLVIYPAPAAPVDRKQYPYFVVYPLGKRIDDTYYYKSMPVGVQGDYPNLVIYPAPSGAPRIGDVLYPFFDLYPTGRRIDDTFFYKSLPVGVQGDYPNLVIYPSLGAHSRGGQRELTLHSRNPAAYPNLVIYPSVYPYLEVYPAVAVVSAWDASQLTAFYPIMSLYPALYPFFEIYPGETCDGSLLATNESLSAAYPVFSLYAAVYPAFEIYPGEVCDGEMKTAPELNDTAFAYPSLVIYPACYPAFELYAREVCDGELPASRLVDLAPVYPCLVIYAAVYPHIDPYHSSYVQVNVGPNVSRRPRRTHRDLHNAVFGAKASPVARATVRRRPRKTHADLHREVFASGIAVAPSPVSVPAARTNAAPVAPSVSIPVARTSAAPVASPLRRKRSGTVLNSALSMPKPAVAEARTVERIAPSPTSRRSLPPIADLPGGDPPPVPPLPAGGLPPRLPRPASTRRSPSSESPVSTLAPNSVLSRAQSLSMKSRVAEIEGLERATSLSPQRSLHQKRDSAVLERARALDSSAATKGAGDPSVRLTMSHLDKFPMPPRPPLPGSNIRPVSVAKLDRSKFPFS